MITLRFDSLLTDLEWVLPYALTGTEKILRTDMASVIALKQALTQHGSLSCLAPQMFGQEIRDLRQSINASGTHPQPWIGWGNVANLRTSSLIGACCRMKSKTAPYRLNLM